MGLKMNVERKYQPVVLTLTSPDEVSIIKWALQLALETTKAAKETDVKQLLTAITTFL
jgi:hypothetical protein